jgi:hypothetical protein
LELLDYSYGHNRDEDVWNYNSVNSLESIASSQQVKTGIATGISDKVILRPKIITLSLKCQ